MGIRFYQHSVDEQDMQRLLSVCGSLFLTTGPVTQLFESQFAAYLGAQHAVGLMSCTQALEVALACLGIGPGDEVITTALSYTATADAIEHRGARPVFVDVEPETGNMDAAHVERVVTKNTRAILPVHLWGHLCDMHAIKRIADKHGLKIVEDSAHCVEGARDGVRPGQLSDMACFSFYATKNITSGEGGAIVTNSEATCRWIRMARSHGINRDVSERYLKQIGSYDKEFLGFKCNMTDLQASLLIGQLERIDRLWERRRALADRYAVGLANCAGLRLFTVAPGAKSAHHLFVIRILERSRDAVAGELRARGIEVVTTNYPPIPLLSYYRQKYGFRPGDFPVAEQIGRSTVTLPLYPKLSDEEADTVVASVKEILPRIPLGV